MRAVRLRRHRHAPAEDHPGDGTQRSFDRSGRECRPVARQHGPDYRESGGRTDAPVVDRAAPRVEIDLLAGARVSDLSGGLDQRKAPTLLKANRARVLQNWSLREPGALVVYPGWTTFSTASLGSGRPQGGQRIYLGSGTPFTLAAWNGGVYKPTDAGVWGAAVSSGWSSSNDIFFPLRPRSRRDLRRRDSGEKERGRLDVDDVRHRRAERDADGASAGAARSSTAIRTSSASPAAMTG
jgi:hypothetical protein